MASCFSGLSRAFSQCFGHIPETALLIEERRLKDGLQSGEISNDDIGLAFMKEALSAKLYIKGLVLDKGMSPPNQVAQKARMLLDCWMPTPDDLAYAAVVTPNPHWKQKECVFCRTALDEWRAIHEFTMIRATGESGDPHSLKQAIFKSRDEQLAKGKWFIACHRVEGWRVVMMNESLHDSVATLPPAHGWSCVGGFFSSFFVRPAEIDELIDGLHNISPTLFPLQAVSAGFPVELADGARVARGPHWKYDDEDGGEGSLGTVTKGTKTTSADWARVAWDNYNAKVATGLPYYRWGQEGRFDLTIIAQGDVISDASSILKQGVCSALGVSINTNGPNCFTSNALFKRPDGSYVDGIMLAKQKASGAETQVLAFDDKTPLNVRRIRLHETQTVIELCACEPTVVYDVITPSHRVVVPFETPQVELRDDGTVNPQSVPKAAHAGGRTKDIFARDLMEAAKKEVQQVMCSDSVPRKLTSIREVKLLEKVAVLEIVLDPDMAVAVFKPPLTFLVKGHNPKPRHRGGLGKRGHPGKARSSVDQHNECEALSHPPTPASGGGDQISIPDTEPGEYED